MQPYSSESVNHVSHLSHCLVHSYPSFCGALKAIFGDQEMYNYIAERPGGVTLEVWPLRNGGGLESDGVIPTAIIVLDIIRFVINSE